MRRLTKKIIILMMLVCCITLYPYVKAMGQGLDVHKLGHDALAQGANIAAAYFLYADYLRNPSEFTDLEITADLLSEMGEYEKADSLLQRVLLTKRIEDLSDSLCFYFYASMARVNHAKNKNIEALHSLSKIPLDDELYELKAACYKEVGLYDMALNVHLSILSEHNKVLINSLIAACYREMGKYTDAIDYYSKALKEKSDWAYPYYGIGWSYALNGDEKNALKYYNEGLSIDPSYAPLFLKRGESYQKIGQNDLAKQDFSSVLLLDKTPLDGSCRQYALFYLGRNKDAINWMNRVIEMQPDNPGNYYDKACLCCLMGLSDEAIRAMEIAFEKGYRKFARLDADDDIAPIKNNPAYRELYEKFYALYLGELKSLKDI